MGEATGREGYLEKSKKYFLEADDIYQDVFGVEYPFYQEQIFSKYAKVVQFYYMLFFVNEYETAILLNKVNKG